MTINLQKPDITELKPKITVFGVGGGGGNAVNNMINGGLEGVDFVVANTDAQALTMSAAEKVIQLGVDVTEGLGAGSQPEVGRAAAEECLSEIADYLTSTHMAFVTAGMGGGTGTGAAPVVARAAREAGVLTVGVVTKPFHFEGQRRMATAEAGIAELQKNVDTLIVIPNQNLFRIANDKTTFSDAFGMADQVLYSGVACITDLMVKEGLINLDFADVRSVMREMGKAMMGTGEASGEGRAMQAAEAAISNPLLDETSMRGAQGLLISITGGRDLTLFEVDEAATRIREEIDADANIILGATFDETLEGVIRVSVVATGIDKNAQDQIKPMESVAAPAVASRPATQAPAPAPVAAESEAAQPVAATRATPRVVENFEERAAELEQRAAKVAQSLEIEEPSAPVERQGVKIEPFSPTAPDFSDPIEEEEFTSALEDELMPSTQEFVPATAEEPAVAVQAPRIPEVQDFPPIAQQEVAASSSAAAIGEDDRGPMGLLKKLKQGFGGKETPAPAAPVQKPVEAKIAQAAQSANRPAAVAPEPSVARPTAQPAEAPAVGGARRVDNNPYAPKQGQLDQTGRITSPEKPFSEEDQLDIPAFLRRQAN